MGENIRIDKWLWTVRLFKTRSLATEACAKGQVLAAGLPVKASKMVKAGDVIKVRRPPIYRSYQIITVITRRVSAPEVALYMTEVTPQSELDLLAMQKDMIWITRDRGAGRPTKKERRDLDDYFQGD